MPDSSETPVIPGSHGTAEAKRSGLAQLVRSIPVRIGVTLAVLGVLYLWVQVYREAFEFERAAMITGGLLVVLAVFWFIKSRAETNDALIADRDHDLIPDDVDPFVDLNHHRDHHHDDTDSDDDPFA